MSSATIYVYFDEEGKLVTSTNNPRKNERTHKGKSILAFPDNYVVLDLETTGLSPDYDEIIEISAIRFESNNQISKFVTLVKPKRRIPEFITELTGISNEMVADSPRINTALKGLRQFLNKEDIILGYNINFDINFLYDNYEYELEDLFTNDFVDVMRFARRLEKDLPNHKLDTLATHYGIKSIHHRAEADCVTCFQCYTKLRDLAVSTFGSTDAFIKSTHHYSSGLRAKDIKATIEEFNEDNPFFSKTVAFTGALERMERRIAMQHVVNMGGVCGDGVTAKTNYLVLGNLAYCGSLKGEKSSKLKKAEALIAKGQDLQIIPENVFYDILSDNGIKTE